MYSDDRTERSRVFLSGKSQETKKVWMKKGKEEDERKVSGLILTFHTPVGGVGTSAELNLSGQWAMGNRQSRLAATSTGT
jgi:hypothetical protein